MVTKKLCKYLKVVMLAFIWIGSWQGGIFVCLARGLYPPSGVLSVKHFISVTLALLMLCEVSQEEFKAINSVSNVLFYLLCQTGTQGAVSFLNDHTVSYLHSWLV